MASYTDNGDTPLSAPQQNVCGYTDMIASERKKLEEERASLEKEKENWLKLKPKLEASQIDDCVTLNVGGTIFACSIDLLRKIPDTYFSALVSGRWEMKKQKDGSLFIDRDPLVFPLIMTYMRKYGTDFDHREWYQSLSSREKLLLEDEADFYLIPQILNLAIDSGSIVTYEEWKMIHSENLNRKLIWDSSSGSYFQGTFQSEMMVGKMIVLVQFVDGSVVGSYSCVAWNFENDYQDDPTSYLFCKPSQSAAITRYNVLNSECACFISDSEIAFGDGHDLSIDITYSPTPLIYGNPNSFPPLPISLSPPKQSSRIEIWTLA